MKNKLSVWLVIAFLSAIANAADSNSDTQVNSLIVHNYSVKDLTVTQALSRLGSQCDIPLAIQRVAGEVEPIISIEAYSGTVEILLRQIAAASPRYNIDYYNGVLHIVAKQLDSDPRNVMNSHLTEFRITAVQASRASLIVQEQVRRQAGASPQSPGGSAGHVVSGLGDKSLTLFLRHPRISDILDAIVKQTRGMWIVSMDRDSA
jgi:hypothetical protein